MQAQHPSSAAPSSPLSTTRGATTDHEEIARFDAIAAEWWDPHGKFRPLHQLNPLRVAFVLEKVARHLGRDPDVPQPLEGLSVLDIGCGGGLVAEALARLGAEVTGIDASAQAIAVADAHARSEGVPVAYRCAAPETLAAERRTFDVVVSMEVVEHVADVDEFCAACSALTRPGGAVALSTLNRTLKSLALAKLGAEYVLRWLPVGTHDWRKFLRPSELAAALRRTGLDLVDLRGATYDPLRGSWSTSGDLDVNYLAFAIKA